MHLPKLFLAESGISHVKLAWISLISGVSNIFLLAVLNSSAQHASDENVQLRSASVFFVIALIYLLTQGYVWVTANKAAENVVHSLRTRLFKKIVKQSLEHVEKIGKADLYTSLIQHTHTVSVSALPLFFSFQGILLVFFILAYLAYLSISAFALTLIFISIIGPIAVYRSKKNNYFRKKALDSEKQMYNSLNDLLDGFNEIKLNVGKENDLTSVAMKLAARAKTNRLIANTALSSIVVATQTSIYVLLAILTFLLPQLSLEAYPEVVIKIVTAGLMLFSPLTALVLLIPTFNNSELAISQILQTEKMLDENLEDIPQATDELRNFRGLSFKDVVYSYQNQENEEGFHIGPLNFDVAQNQVLFITGGNGSGKSTMLKILLGLYQPREGTVSCNGIPVSKRNLASYRNIFSMVLSDYHLFSRTYGLSDIDMELLHSLLAKMGLSTKTGITNGKLNTVDLSTGEKKRLALVISILDDRPVMVFDEWAADQDPEFRRAFYHEILPFLKSKNKTIIAVTHDEKYFDCADYHLHMIEGRLSETTS